MVTGEHTAGVVEERVTCSWIDSPQSWSMIKIHNRILVPVNIFRNYAQASTETPIDERAVGAENEGFESEGDYEDYLETKRKQGELARGRLVRG